jgi:hypothetical protein
MSAGKGLVAVAAGQEQADRPLNGMVEMPTSYPFSTVAARTGRLETNNG